jgi:hypothetical protein
LNGANYVLNYAGKAYYTLCQRGAWDKCLQKKPGESAHINPASVTDTGDKCFNCGGTHHLKFCPQLRDQATINKNRNIHPNGTRQQQPTGFRGNGNPKTPFVRPHHWRLPEEGENKSESSTISPTLLTQLRNDGILTLLLMAVIHNFLQLI